MATSRADVTNSTADMVKFALAGALGLGGLVLFYVFSEASLLLRTIALLLVFAGVCAIMYQTVLGKRTVVFFRDARTEVRKVVWPNRAETTQTTLTVVVIVIIVGIMLWLFDSLLSWLFRLITGI